MILLYGHPLLIYSKFSSFYSSNMPPLPFCILASVALSLFSPLPRMLPAFTAPYFRHTSIFEFETYIPVFLDYCTILVRMVQYRVIVQSPWLLHPLIRFQYPTVFTSIHAYTVPTELIYLRPCGRCRFLGALGPRYRQHRTTPAQANFDSPSLSRIIYLHPFVSQILVLHPRTIVEHVLQYSRRDPRYTRRIRIDDKWVRPSLRSDLWRDVNWFP